MSTKEAAAVEGGRQRRRRRIMGGRRGERMQQEDYGLRDRGGGGGGGSWFCSYRRKLVKMMRRRHRLRNFVVIVLLWLLLIIVVCLNAIYEQRHMINRTVGQRYQNRQPVLSGQQHAVQEESYYSYYYHRFISGGSSSSRPRAPDYFEEIRRYKKKKIQLLKQLKELEQKHGVERNGTGGPKGIVAVEDTLDENEPSTIMMIMANEGTTMTRSNGRTSRRRRGRSNKERRKRKKDQRIKNARTKDQPIPPPPVEIQQSGGQQHQVPLPPNSQQHHMIQQPRIGGGGLQVQPAHVPTRRDPTMIISQNKTLTMDDLKDLVASSSSSSSSTTESHSSSSHLDEKDGNDDNDDSGNSEENTYRDRKLILDMLERAGLSIDDDVRRALPTQEQISSLYGNKPVIVGKETCQQFRDTVPIHQRYVGVAGQMNTGTNALAKYLRNNLIILNNTEHSDGSSSSAMASNGILWTVPWGKHSWIDLRFKYMYKLPREHDHVLPVILIRDPYFWMQSMCESPYTMEWNQTTAHCPNLMEESTVWNAPSSSSSSSRSKNGGKSGSGYPAAYGTPVYIRWGKFFGRTWPSLAHVWSTWYSEYYHDNTFPKLMIRFEDLLFHTETIIDEIRDCVGATWRESQSGSSTATDEEDSDSDDDGLEEEQQKQHRNLDAGNSSTAGDGADGWADDGSDSSKASSLDDVNNDDHNKDSIGGMKKHQFVYHTASAKSHPYFERWKKQSSLVSAMIKYGQDDMGASRTWNMTEFDMEYASQFIDYGIMKAFHYRQPPQIKKLLLLEEEENSGGGGDDEDNEDHGGGEVKEVM